MSSNGKHAAFILLACLSALVFLALGSARAGFSGQLYLPLVNQQYLYISPTPQPGRLLISEVFFDPLTDEPDCEWIELYNPGALPLPLGGYKIGDEETAGQQEGMYSFPAGTVIQPAQVLVIANRARAFTAHYHQLPDFELTESDSGVQNLIKFPAWAQGNANLVNQGDEVVVLDEDNQVKDMVAWGNSPQAFSPAISKVAENHSLERWPADQDTDSARDWRDQWQPGPGQVDTTRPTATPPPSLTPTSTSVVTPTPTRGTDPQATDSDTTPGPGTPVPPSPSPIPANHLLINEVFYRILNPLPGYTQADFLWIVIDNPTLGAIDLSGYRIGNETWFLGDPYSLPGDESVFRFPPDTWIDPAEKVVIALKASAYDAIYHKMPDFEMVDTRPEVPEIIQEPDLGNNPVLELLVAGDEVVLVSGNSEIVDLVAYGNSNSSYFGVSPHPGAKANYSLKRITPGKDTDHCEIDFQEVSIYNTPGSQAFRKVSQLSGE